MDPLFLIGAIIFVAFTVQTLSGFGVVIVTLTLGAHLAPLPALIGWLIPLSIAQCAYLVVRHRGSIAWSLLMRWILPLMGGGMIGGIVLRRWLESDELYMIFAVFVLLLAVRELIVRLVVKPSATEIAAPTKALALVGAGIMHGLYATGGPLLVYALGRTALDKSTFRTTLLLVWLILNTVLVVDFARADMLGIESLYLAPAMLLGLVVGEKLHKRIDQRRFDIGVFGLLAVAAVAMLLRG